MITLENVTKTYGDAVAVEDLSLQVEQGGFLALVGPSGCGKSTTLRMINRLVPHSSGRILLAGRPIEAVPEAELRRGIGYVIQSGGLFPHWTVERNVATVPVLLGWPNTRVRDRVTELLEMLQLDPRRYRAAYPHQLSGGQQQRVGVARALAADPDVLLMDEPFGALDPITRAALQDALRDIHRGTGKTIVFVTHDIDEALRLATHIAVMEHGRLARLGTPAELLSDLGGGFVQRFLGSSDLGLRLLSLGQVSSRMRPLDTAAARDDLPQVPAGADLRHALSDMVAHSTDRLAVVDGNERVGILHLQDLVRP